MSCEGGGGILTKSMITSSNTHSLRFCLSPPPWTEPAYFNVSEYVS